MEVILETLEEAEDGILAGRTPLPGARFPIAADGLDEVGWIQRDHVEVAPDAAKEVRTDHRQREAVRNRVSPRAPHRVRVHVRRDGARNFGGVECDETRPGPDLEEHIARFDADRFKEEAGVFAGRVDAWECVDAQSRIELHGNGTAATG